MENKMHIQEHYSTLLGILHGITDESEIHQHPTNEQYYYKNLLHTMLFTSGRISYTEYKELNPTKHSKIIFHDPNFDVIPLQANLL